MNTKKIVTTAVLLALCIVFQSMKGISVYLTGTAVNTFLIMAALLVGTGSSVFLAVITPLVAYLMGATPIMQMIPLMVPTVMAGNAVLSLCASAGRKKQLPFWLAAGAVLKAYLAAGMVCHAAVFWRGRAGADAACGENNVFCDTVYYGCCWRRDCLYRLWQGAECS